MKSKHLNRRSFVRGDTVMIHCDGALTVWHVLTSAARKQFMSDNLNKNIVLALNRNWPAINICRLEHQGFSLSGPLSSDFSATKRAVGAGDRIQW